MVFKLLEEDEIKIVLVGIGFDVDVNELKNIILVEGYLVKVKKMVDFEKFVEKIMVKVIFGMRIKFLFC